MPLLIVETSNPARQFGVRCADLMAIHKFIGIVPREQLAMPKVPAEAFALEGQR